MVKSPSKNVTLLSWILTENPFGFFWIFREIEDFGCKSNMKWGVLFSRFLEILEFFTSKTCELYWLVSKRPLPWHQLQFPEFLGNLDFDPKKSVHLTKIEGLEWILSGIQKMNWLGNFPRIFGKLEFWPQKCWWFP